MRYSASFGKPSTIHWRLFALSTQMAMALFLQKTSRTPLPAPSCQGLLVTALQGASSIGLTSTGSVSCPWAAWEVCSGCFIVYEYGDVFRFRANITSFGGGLGLAAAIATFSWTAPVVVAGSCLDGAMVYGGGGGGRHHSEGDRCLRRAQDERPPGRRRSVYSTWSTPRGVVSATTAASNCRAVQACSISLCRDL
mmetsp:Transcript_45969/g.127615  ORF Transcript_45969/g.127615 Transcript_45969/m.127615 type:complete len:195 (-) Transcript_45969:13-597(-)